MITRNGQKTSGFPKISQFFKLLYLQFYPSSATIKQQRQFTILANLTIVLFYPSSCLNLTVALVGFIWSNVHPDCTMSVRGGYVAMHEIDIDGAEQKICRGCVDELCMGSKPNKLKKV